MEYVSTLADLMGSAWAYALSLRRDESLDHPSGCVSSMVEVGGIHGFYIVTLCGMCQKRVVILLEQAWSPVP